MGTHAKTGTRRRSPDRLGPLEITIGLMVLSLALVLVLVGRSVASSSADHLGPSTRAALSAPASSRDADGSVLRGSPSHEALQAQAAEGNVAQPPTSSASDAVDLSSLVASPAGDSGDD